MVFAQLIRITGPGRHLEDLLQQTFLEVHRSLGSFRGDSKLSTWIARVAINVAAQYLRSRTRKPPPELGLDEARLADHPTELDTVALAWWKESAGELEGLLRAALAHLWFVTIHPFDDGNGRIARAITDLALVQVEHHSVRFHAEHHSVRPTPWPRHYHGGSQRLLSRPGSRPTRWS